MGGWGVVVDGSSQAQSLQPLSSPQSGPGVGIGGLMNFEAYSGRLQPLKDSVLLMSCNQEWRNILRFLKPRDENLGLPRIACQTCSDFPQHQIFSPPSVFHHFRGHSLYFLYYFLLIIISLSF